MTQILHLAGGAAFLAAVVTAIKQARTTDFLTGGISTLFTALRVPIVLYLLGIVLVILDVFHLATAGDPGSQLVPALALAFLVIASGGMIFSVTFVTIKGQMRAEAAGSVIDALRGSENERVSGVGDAAAENLETRATGADDTPEGSEPATAGQAELDQSMEGESAPRSDSGTGSDSRSTSTTPSGESDTERLATSTSNTKKGSEQTDTAETPAKAPSATDEASANLGRLRRFEYAVYVLAAVPLLLLGYGFVDGGLPTGTTGQAVVAVLVAIALVVALVGLCIRMRWSPGYYAGLWLCGLFSLLGVYGILASNAATALGAVLVVTLPGIFWGSNSKRHF